jgi:hypothetical protein
MGSGFDNLMGACPDGDPPVNKVLRLEPADGPVLIERQ